MIEIKADRFPIHRCIYCKGEGEENIFILSDRWDKNPDLDSKNIVGELVSMSDEVFEILSDDSSPGLGAPICFQLAARRLTLLDKLKRLRAETGAGLMDVKVSLDSYGYDEAKEMLMEKVRRQKSKNRDELLRALAEVVTKDAIAEWLETPSQVLDGLKPLEVIERGELDRVWQMVYALRSGESI